jgi:hypothetical protein
MPGDDLFEQVNAKRAAGTGGQTNEQRLRWLLTFAAIDNFDKIGSSDFHRLQRKIGEFAELSASTFQTPDNTVSREAADRLAHSVSDGMRAYAGGASWDLQRMAIARSVIPQASRSSYNGSWNDAFLMSAADVVQAVGNLLRVCAANGCDVLFIKRKRKIFCSAKCSARERMRRFQKTAARYKARRRKYYLESLKRKRDDSEKA